MTIDTNEGNKIMSRRRQQQDPVRLRGSSRSNTPCVTIALTALCLVACGVGTTTSSVCAFSTSRPAWRPIMTGTNIRGVVTRKTSSNAPTTAAASRRSRQPLHTMTAAASSAVPAPDPADQPFHPGPSFVFGSSGLKLNLFGFVYGMWGILNAIWWWPSLVLCQLVYKIFGRKIDPNRRVPIAITNFWGWVHLFFTATHPIIKGRSNIALATTITGKKTPVMFVANHTSWMDIPFVALAIGWRNYKIIAKQELLKVPLLSRSLRAGGHVILDRTNRRSQLNTYKQGVQWLKDGSNLVTFPEGTRSRTGVLGPFKKGAFKMAQAVNVPIVPLSIAHAHKIQPLDYIFPVRPGRSVPGSVTIGAPISTEGKTDDEVMEEVWNAIAANLPKSQKPEPGTPFSVK